MSIEWDQTEIARVREFLEQRGANEALAQSRGYDLRSAWISAGPAAIDGDLEFAGREFGGGLVVIDGDLTVGGFLRDTWADTTTFIVVLGSLRARDFATADFVFVTGDVTIECTLYGNSGSDHTLFAEAVRTDLLVQDGHSFECTHLVARVGVDTMTKTRYLEPPFRIGIDKLAEELDASLFGRDECLEPERVHAALRGRKSLLSRG
jgi:hypothetical protein